MAKAQRRGPLKRCVQYSAEFLAWNKKNVSLFCSRECRNASRKTTGIPVSKRCTQCKQVMPASAFSLHQRQDRTPGKLYVASRCKACVNNAHDPVSMRDSVLRKRYKLSIAKFDALLAEQGGCKSCGSETTNGKYWHIDHDHDCCPGRNTCGNCIRGILCHGCNTALGNLDDDPRKIEALLAYILEASYV